MYLLSLCSFMKDVVGEVKMGQTIYSVLKKKRKLKNRRNTGSYTKTLVQQIGYYLNKQWKAPNHCVVRTDLLKEIYGFVLGERLLWPLRWFDKIWMFIAGYRGSYKCLDVKYGRKCPSSIITDSEMIHSIPMSLGVHLYWSNFPDMKDSYMRLANFLIKEGHDESFSISFVEEIIRHVP